MLATTNRKWLVSLGLALIVLILALFGGSWGRDFTAMADTGAVPHIDYIDPLGVPTNSPDLVMIIGGSNFGTLNDTRVRITGPGYSDVFKPLYIITTGISLNISHTLLTFPTTYQVAVCVSRPKTIPVNPCDPLWDDISNSVDFIVFEPLGSFLPIIAK